MKSNLQLKKDVEEEIRWVPMLNASDIGVMTNDGVVTLSGTVDSYAKKQAAEAAVKRIAGVRAVAEEIKINLDHKTIPVDMEIAKEAANSLKWNSAVPAGDVKAIVDNGWVTLEGDVQWNYQKESARECIQYLHGVKGVTNLIKIKPGMAYNLNKASIERALDRDASVDNDHIKVAITDHTVVLSGTVQSWFQKDEAARVAWAAPGVTKVENDLVVLD